MRIFANVLSLTVAVSVVVTAPIQKLAATHTVSNTCINGKRKPDYYKLPSDAKLNSKELVVMKAILCKAIADYNRQADTQKINLNEYGIQYETSFDKEGRKIVWINGFCKEAGLDYKNLNLQVVSVFDGGSCFFNTTINIKSGKTTPIKVNGLA
ncbi:hypothetical protein [Hymenobacter baengnokdamensis]|uniref:hypothetical protein n=1 Tax=Hymenobacter baengnokdamensis TaxID=2615203 RepID=UPI00124756C9|nr:hypothetical protein [Hymenobacter baengnokdamensis]